MCHEEQCRQRHLEICAQALPQVVKVRRTSRTARKCRQFLEYAWNRWPWCQWCELDLERWEATVDHIVPLAKGGTHDWSNLCVSCRVCNSEKGGELPTRDPHGPRWMKPEGRRGWLTMPILTRYEKTGRRAMMQTSLRQSLNISV